MISIAEIDIILPMIRTHFVYNTGQGAFPLEKSVKADKLEFQPGDPLSPPFAASALENRTILLSISNRVGTTVALV
jgi:hypothetical protein